MGLDVLYYSTTAQGEEPKRRVERFVTGLVTNCHENNLQLIKKRI